MPNIHGEILAELLRNAGMKAEPVVNDNAGQKNELTKQDKFARGRAIHELLDVGGSPVDWGARSVPGAINREIIGPRSNDNKKR
jgi:hypothetical protein